MLRTVLFAPANDPKKANKAMTSGADAVTLDLEDAVAYSRKDAAREMLKEILRQPPPVKLFVRVNGAGTRYILDDLDAVTGLPVDGLMVAKAETAGDIQKIDWLLSLMEQKKGIPPGKIRLIPFIESPGGVLKAAEIASSTPRVTALAFGGVDFSQVMGLRYPAESEGLNFARSQLVLASRHAGIDPPLDTVFPDIKNVDKLESEAQTARKLGFQGKLVIHPAQLDPVNRVFTPSREEIENARRIVAAFEEAEQSGTAVIQVDGKMVEYPIFRRAKEILRLYDSGIRD
ncbi:MAG: CoA ester lyase [Peptococcaceae bacterium]|nr:CoA ester lyase [Peptococcaceae bacterium]